nr:MAG TPA: minor tail protein [Caudoviricetes sp.]
MAGKKNYELEIMISGGTDSSLAASIKKARKEIDSLERSAHLSAKGMDDAFGGMSIKGIDALGGMSDKVFGAMIKGGAAAAAGLAAGLTAATNVGMGFESQMGTVQAISQASEADMRKLTALAKEMGETTQFSAEEAGKGLEYMAMAGWKTQDMIGGLPGIMYLAAASGEDLGSVSDIVTDAMTAFGMQADEAGHFADVLAQASASSNTNVAMMGATFQYVAPVAGAYGYTIEDVAIATGLMANAGIKGEKAGTAMRTMLTNLAKPTKQMRGYMEALGISLTDGEGKMKDFRELTTDLRSAFADLTKAEKAEYAAGIAGKEGMSGLLAMVTASEDDFNDLTQAIDNSEGAAQKMSEVRLDNLTGDLTLLGSAAQGLGIESYEGFSDVLRGLAQDGTEWITTFTGELREDMPTIQRKVKQFGRDFREGVQPVVDFGGWCLENPETIKGVLTGIVTALGAFKGVQIAKDGFGMLSSLSTMISAWPVAAFGLAAGAIAGIATTVKETNKRLKKEDLAKRFGTVSLSMEELNEVARLIVDDGNMGKAAEAIGELSKVKELSKAFEDSSKDLERLNWKIGMGLELDEGDKETYAAAIDQMVQGAIRIAEQSQYTAQISVHALFGTESEEGNTLLEGFNGMYASINEEVRALGTQLGDAYRIAMEDGIINVDEAKTIQGLQKKLAEVTQEVSQAQFNAKLDRIAGQNLGKELDPESFRNVQAQIQETIEEQKAALGQSLEWSLASVEMQASRENKGKGWIDEQKGNIWDAYNSQTMGMDMRALTFSTESIMDAYADTLAKAIPNLQDGLDTALQISQGQLEEGYPEYAFNPDIIKKNLGLDEIPRVARDGMKDLWKAMEPDYDQMQETVQSYTEAGKEIPEAVSKGLMDASIIGAIAGDREAIMQLLAIKGSQSPEYQEVIKAAQEKGTKVPEEIAAYIDNSSGAVDESVEQLGRLTKEALDRQFGMMSVDGNLDVNLSANLNIYSPHKNANQLFSEVNENTSKSKIPGYAEGGLIASPTLSWFAEKSPEMAIPINDSAHSLSLWQETGRMLGVDYDGMTRDLTEGTSRNSTFAPVFNPVIQIQGGEHAESRFSAGMDEAYERFVDFMERFQKEQYRPAF